jgi:hypothetical protein
MCSSDTALGTWAYAERIAPAAASSRSAKNAERK